MRMRDFWRRGKQPQTGGCVCWFASPQHARIMAELHSHPVTLLFPALLLPLHHLLNPASLSHICKTELIKLDLLWVF